MAPLRRTVAGAALLLLLALLLGGPAAGAAALPSHSFSFLLQGEVKEPGHITIPPPEGELEDACGVAVDLAGDIYVSDYYHRTIDVYDSQRKYLTQIADPDPDGPCNLAVDFAGNVYVNNWRRNVVRFSPSEFPPTKATTWGAGAVIDSPSSPGARSTGLALDPASGDLYVDDRTYVAVYAAATLSETEPVPLRTFGLGSIGQGYGIAVSDFAATEGDVYVPDATTHSVKVFGPSGALSGEIDGAGNSRGRFVSLVDSAVAVDQTNGHLFVADNTEPGFERPAAIVDEFNTAGEYRGQLPQALVDAEPTALAVDPLGNVYATSGNTEGASLLGFGPTLPAHRLQVAKSGSGEGAVGSEPAGIDCGVACAAEYSAGEEVTLTAAPAPGSVFAGWSGGGCSGTALCHLTLGADREVSAEFEALPPQMLTFAAPGPAGIATSAVTAFASSAEGSVSRSRRGRAKRHHGRHRASKPKARSVEKR